MENPCVKCDHFDKCNTFLEENYLQTAASKKPDAPPLLRQALEQYQQSHLKYKHLIENAPDVIIIADTETEIILEASPKAAKLLGIPLDQIIGKHMSKLHPPEEAEKYTELFRKHVQMDSPYTLEEVELCSSDGKKIPLQIALTTAQLGDRKLMYGFFRDMTEQKELQQQLADSEKKYKDLYRNAKVALFRTRISDGKYLACNMAMAKMFGYDSIKACIENRHSTDCYVDKDRRKKLLDKLQKDKQVKNFPVQARDKDGAIIWISITAEIFPEQGCIEGMLTNITASGILTKTEMKIIRIILTGKSNKEIAYRLKRSTRTIEDHRAHIMRKLEVDNIVDLTRKALQYGITPDGE